MLGVEPEVIEFGLELSPLVEAAVPRAAEAAERLVRQWLRETVRAPRR